MRKTGKDVKTHIQYKDRTGTIIPGVTTILNILAKPGLIHWAWKLGTQGIDYRAFRDDAADIGKLTHSMILADLKREHCDISQYTGSQIDLAENSFLKYLDWKKKHTIEPILVEKPLISEIYRFGGTLDLFGKIDGVTTLLDFKTGDHMYLEYICQLAAYDHLITQQGHFVEEYFLVGIPKTENMNCNIMKISQVDIAFDLFLSCKSAYNMQKKAKKEYGI